MSVQIFFCGPDPDRLRNHASALQQVLAARKLDAGLEFIPLCEPEPRAREARIAQAEEAVVFEFPCPGSFPDYEPVRDPHAEIDPGLDADPEAALEQMAEVLAGLGYVKFENQAPLSAEDEAELLAKLKDLGYL